MAKSLHTRSDFDKCTEVHYSCNLTNIDSADFRSLCNHFNDRQSLVALFGVKTGNKYISDFAVLFNVNLNFTFSLNFLDNLTALADNLGNLVSRNLSCKHLWCIWAKLLSWLCNSLQHNLVKDVVPCLVSLFKCLLNHFR